MSEWDAVLDAAALVAFVSTTDLSQAEAFYGDTLGLSVEEVTPYACVVRSANVALRITLVHELTPQPFTVLGWEVDDLDGTVTALVARGVRPLEIEGMGQDERGIWTAPDGTQVWWFHDPDGNTLSLSHHARG